MRDKTVASLKAKKPQSTDALTQQLRKLVVSFDQEVMMANSFVPSRWRTAPERWSEKCHPGVKAKCESLLVVPRSDKKPTNKNFLMLTVTQLG